MLLLYASSFTQSTGRQWKSMSMFLRIVESIWLSRVGKLMKIRKVIGQLEGQEINQQFWYGTKSQDQDKWVRNEEHFDKEMSQVRMLFNAKNNVSTKASKD